MSKKAKSMIPMTGEEKNALHQIARFDSRITDDNTVVRLDKTVRNKDGSKVKKYVIAQGEKVKYKADFIEDIAAGRSWCRSCPSSAWRSCLSGRQRRRKSRQSRP